MKRIISLMVIAVLIAGTVFAQDKSPRENNRQHEITTVSVEGTLKLDKGFASVQSGDTVYRIPMLNRFVAANDLKDGAKVSVEGNAFRNFIMPKKIVIDGKTIDLAIAVPRPTRNFEPGQHREFPGKDMAPREKFNPGQKDAPNPHPRVRNRGSESS
jgi:hypothetical protein